MKKKTIKLMFVLLCSTLAGFSQEQQKNYPSTYLGDTIQTSTIPKATLLEALSANPTISVRMANYCTEETWTVASFQISIIERGMESASVPAQGNTIPQSVLNKIQKSEPTFVIQITGVRAVSSLDEKAINSNDLMISVKE